MHFFFGPNLFNKDFRICVAAQVRPDQFGLNYGQNNQWSQDDGIDVFFSPQPSSGNGETSQDALNGSKFESMNNRESFQGVDDIRTVPQ